MATTLLSPGVSVTVTDESQYLPAAQNTIPFVLIATAQDKVQGTSSQVAQGTLKENANKLYLVSSQRDLATVYGNPYFYKTATGTPINGYELNEYGLQAAYSALGVSNRCYVQRVDIDLSELVGSASRPDGTPPDNSYWLDTTNTRWGIFEFDPTTASTATSGFTLVTPNVITSNSYINTQTGVPLNTFGSVGDFAVNALDVTNPLWYKVDTPGTTVYNTWVQVGSTTWQQSIPALSTATLGTAPISANTAGTLIINGTSLSVTTSTTLSDLATAANTAINNADFVVNSGKLNFFGYEATTSPDGGAGSFSVAGDPWILEPLGIGNYGAESYANTTSFNATASEYQVTFTSPSAGFSGLGTTITISAVSGTTTGTYAITNGTVVSSTSTTVTVRGYGSFPGQVTASAFNATFTSGSYGPTAKTDVTVTSVTQATGANTTVRFNNLTPELTLDDTAYYSVTGGNIAGLRGYVQAVTSAAGSLTVVYPAGASIPVEVNTAQTLASVATVTLGQVYGTPIAQQSAHTTVPAWGPGQAVPRPAGSIWNKTTAVNNGEFLSVKRYNSGTKTWIAQNCPIYVDDATATRNLDPSGGGLNIAAGATYAQSNLLGDGTVTVEIFERYAQGTTIVTSQLSTYTFNPSDTVYVSVSQKNSSTLTTPALATLPAAGQGSGTGGAITAQDFVYAIQELGIREINASVLATGQIQLIHNQGGVILLANGTNAVTPTDSTTIQSAGFDPLPGANGLPNVKYANPEQNQVGDPVLLSNWVGSPTFEYTAGSVAPFQNPVDGTLWYYSSDNQADILIHNGTTWVGYKNGGVDIRGFDLGLTDPNGPIVSPTKPMKQSNGTSPLQLGDLWIDTSDLEIYPNLYRYEEPVANKPQWVKIDLTDQTSQNGILFADTRWATSGAVDPVNDPIPTIQSLLTSDYLDLDAPDPTLSPNGMLLWNTRRSGYNVKRYAENYFTESKYPEAGAYDPTDPTAVGNLPNYAYTWVTQSGNQTDGSMYAGRKAQRAVVVKALKAGVDTSIDIRADANQFNLIACPNYPELIPNMVVLNNDRNNTSFVIGDTPMRLDVDPQTLQAYATNVQTGQALPEDNVTTGDPYVAVYYPAAQTVDNTGTTVVVPSSHMMIRTYIRNDSISYPWFAPAGVRRGVVDNATDIGYINAQTGEFVQTKVGQSVRDILYPNNINPITFIPGVGITAYGQKTRYGNLVTTSALDRVNVARLVVYLRQRLQQAMQNYLFEPNDKLTRTDVTNTVSSLLNDVASKRGLYDYLVICDETNNTPERIDRNELYVDIAIEPVKAIEFIYIPIRIKNTGEIAAGNV